MPRGSDEIMWGPLEWFRRDDPLAEDTMLAYFLSALEVRSQRIEHLFPPDGNRQKLFEDAKARLANFSQKFSHNHPQHYLNDAAWNEAYRIERLLALAEPPDTLISELQRRIDEATDESVTSAPRIRKSFEATLPAVVEKDTSPPNLKPAGERILRDMLLDVLEDIHWTYQRKFHSRPIQRSATTRLIGIALIAFILFLLPYVYLYVKLWQEKYDLPFRHWAWLPLWTALTSGFFGAMFSRLLSLQTNWNTLSLGALKDARDYRSIFLRGSVGMIGAVVVFFFLQSNILTGGLFPNFQAIAIDQRWHPSSAGDSEFVPMRLVLPNASLALLVVWSFLAGFSERLVPSILQSTETSLGEASRQAK